MKATIENATDVNTHTPESSDHQLERKNYRRCEDSTGSSC